MKTKNVLMVVAVFATVLAFNYDAHARGGAGGAGGGQGMQVRNQIKTQTKSQVKTATQTAVRPEDSQRRDGTFLTTGTTANGSTTRPANGKGVMDGTGINSTVPTTTTVQ